MKNFSKNDSGFICNNCKKEVMPLGYTSRNHCPYCLCSLHVDNSPGDRQNSCHGLMVPIGIEISAKKGKVILFKCTKCGEIKKNVSAFDDNEKLILEIMSKQ